jgi:DNA polymerase I-like protein with 3'-5' exonuclease and polymerase domains
VQGVCASIFKKALVNIDRYYSNGTAQVILPVHDEFQVQRRARLEGSERSFIKGTIECMTDIEEVTDRDLLLKVDVSKSKTNWAEKEKVKE